MVIGEKWTRLATNRHEVDLLLLTCVPYKPYPLCMQIQPLSAYHNLVGALAVKLDLPLSGKTPGN